MDLTGKHLWKSRTFTKDFYIAILLSLAGGYLELYSLCYRGFWGMMMTGNMVYMTQSVVSGRFVRLFTYVPVIICFFFGIFLALYIENRLPVGKKRMGMLILITLLLVAVIAIPTVYEEMNGLRDADEESLLNIGANCLLAVDGAFLYQSFSRFDQNAYAPTMMTANLTRMSSALYISIFGGEEVREAARLRMKQYFCILASFLFAGGLCYAIYYHVYRYLPIQEGCLTYFPNLTLLFPLFLILICLWRVIKEDS